MFVVALLNALGREGRGNRLTEVVLMLVAGDSVTAERGRNRLMSWRRGEMSGHELAREPGIGGQRDHRLCRMPRSSSTCAAAHRRKRLRDGPGPSFSVDSSTAAPPLKRMRMNDSCSSSEENEDERDRDPDLGDDRDVGEEG